MWHIVMGVAQLGVVEKWEKAITSQEYYHVQ